MAIKIRFNRPEIDEKTQRPVLDGQNNPKDYTPLGEEYEPKTWDRLSVHVGNRREKGTIVRAVTDLANALGIDWEIVTDDDRVGYLGDQQDALQARIHQNDDPIPKVERSDDERYPPNRRSPLTDAATPPNSAPPVPKGDLYNEGAATPNGPTRESSDENGAIADPDKLHLGESPNKGPVDMPKTAGD